MAHFNYLPKEVQDELRTNANAIVAPGKGILAADESTGIVLCLIVSYDLDLMVLIYRNNGKAFGRNRSHK